METFVVRVWIGDETEEGGEASLLGSRGGGSLGAAASPTHSRLGGLTRTAHARERLRPYFLRDDVLTRLVPSFQGSCVKSRVK
jgi:hypothetical protein